MSKPIVILHHRNCSDGFGAAWAAYTSSRGKEMEFIGVNYHEPIPDIVDKEVFILDFCYPRGVLLDLKSKNKSLVVLDHHATAREDCEGLGFCTFDMNRSGAGLAWDHFHMEQRPLLIDLIEYRDLGFYWNNKTHEGKFENIKPILAYVDSFDKTFDNWSHLNNELNVLEQEQVIAKGESILRYQEGLIKYLLRTAKPFAINGKMYEAVNTSLFQSDIGNILAERNGVGITWNELKDGRVKFSLRGDDHNDVAKIAKMYGGGGHIKASGFTLGSLHELLNLAKEDV